MTIHILGLGESLEDYKKDENITIGVNDIHSKIKTDFVVCVDDPRAFSPERLKTIEQTKCKGFYSQVDYWKKLDNFNKIEFNLGRGLIDGLDNDKFCYSISSPYVATILAYKMKATEIVLHGVDFRTHKHFVDHSKDKALNDFKKLNSAFKKRGVKLFVSSDWSDLSRFLPVWK